MTTIIITVLIYSAIITASQLYKDSSSYSFGPDPIDVVVAGPMMWLLLFVGRFIVRPVYKKFFSNRKGKEKPTKLYSRRKAKCIVKRVVRAQKKLHEKHPNWYDDCFVMERHYSDYYGTEGIVGLEDVPVKKARYEYLNKKYYHLLYNQFDLLVEIIKPYFERYTIEDFIEKNFNKTWIKEHEDEELWKLK